MCVVSIWIHLLAPKSSATSLIPSQGVLLGSVQCVQTKFNANQSAFSVKMPQKVVANWMYVEFFLLPFY